MGRLFWIPGGEIILIRGGGRVRVRGAVTIEAEVRATGCGGSPRAKDAGVQ